MFRFSRKSLLAIITAAACGIGGATAQANLLTALPEMGDLTKWAVFTLGAGTSDTDELTGTVDVFGDVGVAGSGNITMTGNATIHGRLNYHIGGTFTRNGNATVTGGTYQNNSELGLGVSEAIGSSNHADTFTTSSAYTGISSVNLSSHQNLTIVATHDRPGNTTVLNLTDFTLSGGSSFTLQGTASDNFIINVSRQFSLTGSSKIVLSGGVAWDDVLFHVRGSGRDVTIDGQSYLEGILMANNQTVKVTGGSTVKGEIVANKVVLNGGAQVIHPPTTSP
jgi:cytoskeletal protein CcmA (bactofilin family)